MTAPFPAIKNRIFWGALFLLLVKMFIDYYQIADEHDGDYRSAMRSYEHYQFQGLRFDTKTIVDLMHQYQVVIMDDEVAEKGIDAVKIAQLLEDLKEERRRFNTYIDIKTRRPKPSLSSRENRTLRFYLYALDKAIRDLTGEDRRRRTLH
ncbi:hypothetical protein COB28_03245 [Candidatus Dependentiae bacterium]|nr:MAG: hypothetical protein COB28_03245 [Candidatus Dependentiae bacterium]